MMPPLHVMQPRFASGIVIQRAPNVGGRCADEVHAAAQRNCLQLPTTAG